VDTGAIRFGGAFGVICVLAVIPVYVAGSRDSSTAFAAANGIAPLLHILFGLAFLGVLVAMLHQAAGPTPGVYAALAGGVLFFTLTAGGFALVAFPAAVAQSGAAAITEFNEPLLTLATSLYSYCQIGSVAMIFATSAVVWRTSVLPRWTAVGAVLGFLPLLHTLIPMPAALSSLVWILLIGLVMLIAPIGAQETPQRVNDAPGLRK
jgi:hypothetical protein